MRLKTFKNSENSRKLLKKHHFLKKSLDTGPGTTGDRESSKIPDLRYRLSLISVDCMLNEVSNLRSSRG